MMCVHAMYKIQLSFSWIGTLEMFSVPFAENLQQFVEILDAALWAPHLTPSAPDSSACWDVAIWQMCGDFHTLFYWGFTSSRDTRSWSVERERQREKEVQNPFTYSPPSFQSPSGCSMWQHTENSLCKINSFQHVSHAKFPSARASGKCGHQLPYEQIHCCVWRVYTFIWWHILLTICNAHLM